MTNPIQLFFEKERWEEAIKKCCDKQINKDMLATLCSPQGRISLYRAIKNGQYRISPPAPKKIPKDDGTFRTVYVNTDLDRIVLSIYNDMMFELCGNLVHPACKSYRKHISCGKTVRYIAKNTATCRKNEIGVKLDLSKYFDSVQRHYINQVFDQITAILGPFAVTDIVRDYYNDDTIQDANGNLIEKFTSLKQGCPFSAFLADAVLYDIDSAIAVYDIAYARYSDDIVIIGNDWQNAYRDLAKRLAEKNLAIHPHKTEPLYKNKWFKFLGFMIKDGSITLSPAKIKTFDKTIRQLTINSHRSLESSVKAVNDYLYGRNDAYSWCATTLSVVNNHADIATLNAFAADALRAVHTHKTNIGKLSCSTQMGDRFITRSTGKNVTANMQKIPTVEGYLPLEKMRHLMLNDYEAYQNYLTERITKYGQYRNHDRTGRIYRRATAPQTLADSANALPCAL